MGKGYSINGPCSVALIAATALAGCGTRTPEQLGTAYVKSALITAGQAGSVVINGDEGTGADKIARARIDIPAGALPVNATAWIGFGPDNLVTDKGSQIGPGVSFGIDGADGKPVALQKQVTITIPFEGAVVPRRLRAYAKRSDGTTSLIVASKLSFDLRNRIIRFFVQEVESFQSGMAPQTSCDPTQCGPAPGVPNWKCEDGTLGGPTGNCLPQEDGSCTWEINWCTAACDPTECGPVPPIAAICTDGSMTETICERRNDGTCGWDIRCANDCTTSPAGGSGSCDPTTNMCSPPNPGMCDPSGANCPPMSGCDPTTGNCPTTMVDAGMSGGGSTCNPMLGNCPPQSVPDATTMGGGTSCNPMLQMCPPQPSPDAGTIGPCNPMLQKCPPPPSDDAGMPQPMCDPTTTMCPPPVPNPIPPNTCKVDCRMGPPCPMGLLCDATTGDCVPDNVSCGNHACGPGEVCCNPSCGICAPVGIACAKLDCPMCTDASGQPCPAGTMCDPTTGTCTGGGGGQSCGSTTCGPKEYCCNASCGTCAPLGSTCPQIACTKCGPMGIACQPGFTCDPTGACVPACGPNDCGPPPGVPSYICEDGTTGGFTGNCIPSDTTMVPPTTGGANGGTGGASNMPACVWEIRWCPQQCTAMDCGPTPISSTVCTDGSPTKELCRRNADGSCSWQAICPMP
jgi:hypothetical protein